LPYQNPLFGQKLAQLEQAMILALAHLQLVRLEYFDRP
jgi:hypothetical protein